MHGLLPDAEWLNLEVIQEGKVILWGLRNALIGTSFAFGPLKWRYVILFPPPGRVGTFVQIVNRYVFAVYIMSRGQLPSVHKGFNSLGNYRSLLFNSTLAVSIYSLVEFVESRLLSSEVFILRHAHCNLFGVFEINLVLFGSCWSYRTQKLWPLCSCFESIYPIGEDSLLKRSKLAQYYLVMRRPSRMRAASVFGTRLARDLKWLMALLEVMSALEFILSIHCWLIDFKSWWILSTHE